MFETFKCLKQSYKSISLIYIIFSICFSLHSQENSKKLPVNFEVKTGASLSIIKTKGNRFLGLPPATYKPGFNAGISAQITALNKLIIEPGIYFSLKGTSTERETLFQYKITRNLYYIELQTNFKYQFTISNANLFVFAGPYFARGAFGKEIIDFGEEKLRQKIIFRNHYNGTRLPSYSKIDAGINLAIGYEFKKRYSVQLTSQWGLININTLPKESDLVGRTPGISKNSGFGLLFGYKLKNTK